MATGATVGKALSAVTAGKLTSRAVRSQRAFALFIVATGLLSLQLFRLAQLQLVQGNYNRSLAENNRIRRLPMVADRGNIVDRHGAVLAANQLVRSVYLYPREQTKEQWQSSVVQLGAILKMELQVKLPRCRQIEPFHRDARMPPGSSQAQVSCLSCY